MTPPDNLLAEALIEQLRAAPGFACTDEEEKLALLCDKAADLIETLTSERDAARTERETFRAAGFVTEDHLAAATQRNERLAAALEEIASAVDRETRKWNPKPTTNLRVAYARAKSAVIAMANIARTALNEARHG